MADGAHAIANAYTSTDALNTMDMNVVKKLFEGDPNTGPGPDPSTGSTTTSPNPLF